MATTEYRDGQWLRFHGQIPGAHTAHRWTLGIFRPAEKIIFRTPKKRTIKQPDRIIPLTVQGVPIRLNDRDWRNLRREMPGLLSRLEPPRTEFLVVAFRPESLADLCPVYNQEDLPPGLLFREFYRKGKA